MGSALGAEGKSWGLLLGSGSEGAWSGQTFGSRLRLVGGSRHEHLSSLRVWRLEPPPNLTCEEDIVEPVFQQLPGLLRPTQHHSKAALGRGGADRSPQTQLSSSGMVQPAWSPPTLLLPDLDNPS